MGAVKLHNARNASTLSDRKFRIIFDIDILQLKHNLMLLQRQLSKPVCNSYWIPLFASDYRIADTLSNRSNGTRGIPAISCETMNMPIREVALKNFCYGMRL